MPPNAELFSELPLSVACPDGVKSPRLWVRRLKIWESPGGEVIRDIELRPGLNIIWSPDGDDDPNSDDITIGHGSGKTLFCRLLRYCLGETRFADEVQRDAISSTLLNGIVGAEIILDGICWAVARPIGIGRKHFAIRNGDLDAVASMEGAANGIEPLVDAIETNILGEQTAQLARLAAGQRAWPIALAWASRDQECRFDDVLDWRSPISGSDSPQPASGDAKGPRLLAMRALLNALTEEEQTARTNERALSNDLEKQKQLKTRLEWEYDRRIGRLIRDLGLENQSLPEMPLLLQALQSRANEGLAAAAELPEGESTEISSARGDLQNARSVLQAAEVKQSGLASSLPIQRALLSQYESEIPNLSAALQLAETAVCPTCERPLAANDDAQHGIEAHRQRLEQKGSDIAQQNATIQSVISELEALKGDIATAVQGLKQAEDRVSRLEIASDQRRANWRRAIQSVDETKRCGDIIEELETTKKAIRKQSAELETVRNKLRAFEDKQAKTFGDLSQKFSATIRQLLGNDAKGNISLTGKGLDISINVGGDRRSAATESLKVIAFDLACLCQSIEGRTQTSSFLIHDSPREADLGFTIYNDVFRLVHELETNLAGPVFQYIITTTTRPPVELNCEPWRRQILRGAPSEMRLLGRDL